MWMNICSQQKMEGFVFRYTNVVADSDCGLALGMKPPFSFKCVGRVPVSSPLFVSRMVWEVKIHARFSTDPSHCTASKAVPLKRKSCELLPFETHGLLFEKSGFLQARTVHPYPTLGEAVQQCALNYNRARWTKLTDAKVAGVKTPRLEQGLEVTQI